MISPITERMLSISEREQRLGEELIGDIDDDGMLSCTIEEAVEGINGWLEEVRLCLFRGPLVELAARAMRSIKPNNRPKVMAGRSSKGLVISTSSSSSPWGARYRYAA